jgi:hypothetical protein
MNIDFNKIPSWWPLCPNAGCPQAADCLRHQALLQAPASVTHWPCLMPSAYNGTPCDYFIQARTVRLARGFADLMRGIRSRDTRHNTRMALTAYFGSRGSYYRYRDGERPLSPQQEQEVTAILRRNGITDEEPFDEYFDTFDYTHIANSNPR